MKSKQLPHSATCADVEAALLETAERLRASLKEERRLREAADIKATLKKAGVNFSIRYPVDIPAVHYEASVEKTTIVGTGGDWNALVKNKVVTSTEGYAWVCAASEEETVRLLHSILKNVIPALASPSKPATSGGTGENGPCDCGACYTSRAECDTRPPPNPARCPK